MSPFVVLAGPRELLRAEVGCHPTGTRSAVSVMTAATKRMAIGQRDRIAARNVAWRHRLRVACRAGLQQGGEMVLAPGAAASYVLAAAGLLNGRSATTHWREAEHFQRTFP
ncbi:MAG: AraC family transcriptional regulator [Sphaerisporangium sp.]|nr:AraC family transcriptional regulator [Sphaerisporangium sp.]